MLQPKRTKFRKMHKGRNRGLAQGTDVSFGSFGLKAVGRGRLTARQIEAARRAMTRAVKRQGKILIRVFPDKPITEKPLAVRMGKGKGNVEYWVALIQRVKSCMKWTVFRKSWPVKHSSWQQRNCRLKPPL